MTRYDQQYRVVIAEVAGHLIGTFLPKRAAIAVNSKWARCDDPSTATAPARWGFLARFDREVDPDGTLNRAERAKRAKYARRTHMRRYRSIS